MTKKTELAELVVTKQELPIETKLSRSEVIDLLVDRMDSDIDRQIKDLETQMEDLKVLHLHEIEDILPQATFKLMTTYDGTVNLCMSNGPRLKGFGDRVRQIKELEAERSKLWSLKSELGSKKAKNVILRKFLEASSEGKEVLKKMEDFRVGLQTKLLEAVGK